MRPARDWVSEPVPEREPELVLEWLLALACSVSTLAELLDAEVKRDEGEMQHQHWVGQDWGLAGLLA